MYERPMIQSKLIFFCNVPKLAMKNHLCFVSNAVDCCNFIGKVAESFAQEGGAINLRLTVLDTDSSSHTMLGVLCCEVMRNYTRLCLNSSQSGLGIETQEGEEIECFSGNRDAALSCAPLVGLIAPFLLLPLAFYWRCYMTTAFMVVLT